MARIITNFSPTNPSSKISDVEAWQMVNYLRVGRGTEITISHYGRCPWDNPRAHRVAARELANQITERIVRDVRAG